MTNRVVRLVAAVGLLLPLLLVVPVAPSLADRNEAGTAALADFSRQLSVGHLHTCSVLDTGGVQCWGSNDNGRLGDGTTATSTVPVVVSGLSAVTDVSAGGSHTCARLQGGTVRCWGLNGNGQLGAGTGTESLVPVTVSGLTGARRVSAGGFHSCALVTGGLVRCWGHDGMGQTGDGSPGDASTTPTTVVGITAADRATAISTGEFHSCALLLSGTVRCWGHNGFGQLGDGTTADRAVATPVLGLPDPAGNPVVALTTGSSHTCVLLDDDTARCWGQNAYGQLGHQTPKSDSGTPLDPTDDVMTPSTTPLPVQYDADPSVFATDLQTLDGMTSVAAGQYHTCSRMPSGTARCWGNNQRAQLGADPNAPFTPKKTEDSAAAIQVAGLAGADAVSAGGFSSCALVGTAIRCWGYNFYGQLGGYRASSDVPVTVTALAGATSVTAGTDFACALVDAATPARPFCWGSNADGRLGNGTSVLNTTVRVPVSGIASASSIDAGNGHACAVPQGSGVPRCWGSGSSGQLGSSATANSSTPLDVTALTTATSVDAGGLFNGVTERGHSCAVRADTKVVCWGANGAGQLGDNTTVDRSTPVVVQVDSQPDPDPDEVQLTDLRDVVEVVTGGAHSCARRTGGDVVCWGGNASGQLGDNTTGDRSWADTVQGDDDPDTDTPYTGVTALAAGETHTCARQSDGKVACWGAGGSGRLGDGATSTRTHPVNVVFSPPQAASLVTAGGAHSCATLVDGSLWCWGENGDGQLGNGSTSDSSSPVNAFEAPGVSAAVPLVTSLSASRRNTCARLIDYTVSCWGDNSQGQLGDGIGVQSLAPVTVANLRPVAGNHVPEPTDDTVVTSPGNSVNVAVLGNDTDPDGDSLTVVDVSDPANGSAVINTGTTVTYTPDPGFCGNDTFTYAVSDGTATVPANITVTMNCGPAAVNDAVTTAEDTPVVVPVLANDTDPDGDALTITAVGLPASGTVSVTGGGTTVTYVPAADSCSPPTDTFTYTVSDGPAGHVASAAVTVTVTCVDDAPRAEDDVASTPEDTPVLIDVLANDAEVDGSTKSLVSVTSAAHGSVTVQGSQARYAPATDYCGPDSFGYTVSDGALTDTATVTVSVTCVAESPNARDDDATATEDTATTIPVLANDTDPDGDPLSVSIVTDPLHGTASPNGSGPVHYAPDPDFCGLDTFQYVATDGALTDTATVNVMVACVGDAPVPADDSATVTEDSEVHVHVLTNDSDPDRDPLLVVSATDPPHGTTTAFDSFVRYAPDPDFCGADTFDYTVRDPSGATGVAHVAIQVTCVNDAPRIASNPDQTTPWGESVLVLLSATDADPGQPLSFSLVSGPAGATVSATGAFSWTPGPGQVGGHVVTVAVGDGTLSDTTSFAVTVTRRATTLVYTGGTSGQVTDPVGVGATLTDAATGGPVAGRTLTFTVGSQTTSGATGQAGSVAKTLILLGPVGPTTATSQFAGDGAYGPSSDSRPFSVGRESMTTSFTGTHLTLTTTGPAPVTLRAALAEADDGFVAPTMGSPTVTFRTVDGTVLCSASASSTGPGRASASCTTSPLAVGSVAIVVSVATPAYVGQVDVAVITVAAPVRGDAAGAGRAGGDRFGFVAKAARKGAPAGDAVHVVMSAATATVVRAPSLSSLTTSCTGGGTKVCTATIMATGATTRLVDLDTGGVTSPTGTSTLRVDVTDAAEPTGAATPPDRYAVAAAGAVTRSVGTPGAQVLLEAGNIRVPS